MERAASEGMVYAMQAMSKKPTGGDVRARSKAVIFSP
jgi:hypothetical protein